MTHHTQTHNWANFVERLASRKLFAAIGATITFVVAKQYVEAVACVGTYLVAQGYVDSKTVGVAETVADTVIQQVRPETLPPRA